MQKCRRRIGFTLVEMVFVIAILGALLGIAIPATQEVIKVTRGRTSSQNLATIEAAKRQFYVDHPWLTEVPSTRDLLPYLKYGIPRGAWPEERYLDVLSLTKVTASSVNGVNGYEPRFIGAGDNPLANGYNDLGEEPASAIKPVFTTSAEALNVQEGVLPSGGAVWKSEANYNGYSPVTVEAGKGGVAVFSINQDAGGGIEGKDLFTAPGTAMVGAGGEIKATATASEGYVFNGWSNNGVASSGEQTIAFSAPSSGATLQANFISLSELGSIWATPTSQTVGVGDMIYLTAGCSPEVDPTTLQWTMPDMSSKSAVVGGAEAMPALSQPGTYTYVIKGQKNDTREEVSANATVTVTNSVPYISMSGPTTVTSGVDYQITAKILNYSGNLKYNWTWSGGSGNGGATSAGVDSQVYQDVASFSAGTQPIYSGNALLDAAGNLVVPETLIQQNKIAEKTNSFFVIDGGGNTNAISGVSNNALVITGGQLSSGDTVVLYENVGAGESYTIGYSCTVEDGRGGQGSGFWTVTVAPTTGTNIVLTAPTNLVATVGDSVAFVTWDGPTNSGGLDISGYLVYVGKQFYATTQTNSITITGLENGVEYDVEAATLYGTNASPLSEALVVMSVGAPLPPQGISVTTGDGSLSIDWGVPANAQGSAILGYGIYVNGELWTNVLGDAAGAVVGGLVNGQAYSLGIIASNAVGQSPVVTYIGTPYTVPGVPTSLSVSPGNTTLAVSWAAPTSTGGSAITGYNVYVNGTLNQTVTGTNTTISSLTNGTSYAVSVAANNAAGTGTATTAVIATPYLAAGYRISGNGWVVSYDYIGGQLVHLNSYLNISNSVTTSQNVTIQTVATGVLSADGTQWTGSSTQTYFYPPGYQYTKNTGPVISPWSSYAFSSRGAPTSYSGPAAPYFYTPYRAAGDYDRVNINPYSTDINHIATATVVQNGPVNVITYTVPAAPIGLTVTPGDATLTLSWTPPTSTGGYPVTGYNVYLDGSLNQTVTGTVATISSLTNGTSYAVSVAALNGNGTGTVSGVVNAAPGVAP